MNLSNEKCDKVILIAEDDPTTSRVLELGLSQAGYKVLTVQDGAAALERARENHPDLIILDVVMPRMNGNEVTRQLKFDSQYQDIPILMLTARSQPRFEKESHEAGVDRYVKKPFEFLQLLPIVDEMMQESED